MHPVESTNHALVWILVVAWPDALLASASVLTLWLLRPPHVPRPCAWKHCCGGWLRGVVLFLNQAKIGGQATTLRPVSSGGTFSVATNSRTPQWHIADHYWPFFLLLAWIQSGPASNGKIFNIIHLPPPIQPSSLLGGRCLDPSSPFETGCCAASNDKCDVRGKLWVYK